MQLFLPWCSPLQVRNVKVCHCRFRSMPSWNVRSWTQTPLERKPLWAGSFLACIGGSLRFSDAQHISWSSLCISHFTLRGICYRTKTTKRGAPFAFLGFGAYSSSREFGMNWLSAWILLLDSIWHGLRASFGCQVTPDCFFFTMGTQGFSPASYAQTLLRLRNFLQESGTQPEQAANYTLHSLKVTMLSWMAQPVIDQQPASGQAGPKASASQPSPPAATPQTPPEFCDTVAQEAYTQPAPQAVPSATPHTAPAPQPGPAVAAAKPVGTTGPAVAAAKPAGTAAPKTVAQKQPPPKPARTPAADPAATGPPKAQPKEKAPPPPLNVDDTTADPPSQPPAQGASGEAERAPLLAADAPASRVGSVINDGSGNPSLCLVQLWACRRKCGACENAFCQATFPDRSNSFHTLHRCRDCKRAEGRARVAQQAPASSEENWQHSSWEWNSNAWTPAWGSQDGWQEGWHQGWH